jgi:hypothetical protein
MHLFQGSLHFYFYAAAEAACVPRSHKRLAVRPPKVSVELDVAKLDIVSTTVHVYFLALHGKVVGYKIIIVFGNLLWFMVPIIPFVSRWYSVILNEDLSNISRDPVAEVGPFAFLAVTLVDACSTRKASRLRLEVDRSQEQI